MDIIKADEQNRLRIGELDSTGSIKRKECLDQQTGYQFQKKNFTLWNYFKMMPNW
jgi:hypothetical protein